MTESAKPESSLIFSIRRHHKAIPYFGSGPRPDGAENYGFKTLKGRTGDADLIPEAQDNAAIKNALIALNDQATPFFTVGCEKSCNQQGSAYWMRGYLEFSFNYTEMASDAMFYFKLFFGFNRWFLEQPPEATVQYHFELEGAHFMDISADGYTVVVWITTVTLPTVEVTQKAWAWALHMLVIFLQTVEIDPSLKGRIY
jgi:hypothetical protein